MKYMNWSWDEYNATPTEVVEQVIAMINEEVEEAELARTGM